MVVLVVPAGRDQNSPAIYGWDLGGVEIEVPAGRLSSFVPTGLGLFLALAPSDKSLGYSQSALWAFHFESR